MMMMMMMMGGMPIPYFSMKIIIEEYGIGKLSPNSG